MTQRKKLLIALVCNQFRMSNRLSHFNNPIPRANIKEINQTSEKITQQQHKKLSKKKVEKKIKILLEEVHIKNVINMKIRKFFYSNCKRY